MSRPVGASPHLLVAISAHGFGHLGQVAPVVNALRRETPDLRLTLRTGLPLQVVRRRIRGPFALQAAADDIGMRNTNAFDVDVAASMDAYREVHDCWEEHVERCAAEIAPLAPDLLLADVSYLTLAAANGCGIPAIAMSSLNWADIFWHYCNTLPGAQAIHRQIIDAYRCADLFLRLTPGMEMASLPRVRPIGPVAEEGRNRREEFEARHGLPAGERWVVVALGGIDTSLDVTCWPRQPGLRWIVPQAWAGSRADMLSFETLDAPFVDLLASSDALVTKPGYGTFAEAAGAGIPLLYVPREDWPESPCLIDWVEANTHCRVITRKQLQQGDLLDALAIVLEKGRYRAVAPAGVAEAAVELRERLEG